MTRDYRDFDEQFAETEDECHERRLKRHKRVLETHWALIEDLAAALADEGPSWSFDGLNNLRRRTANALPEDRCPDWLSEYRDPKVTQS